MQLLLDAHLSLQFPCIRRSPVGFRSSFRAFVVPVDSVDPVDLVAVLKGWEIVYQNKTIGTSNNNRVKLLNKEKKGRSHSLCHYNYFLAM